MKKIIITSIIILFMIIISLPFITGNLEKEPLNDETRKPLPGKFIKLSDGVTHYDLQGPDNARTIILVHGNAAPYITWDHTIEALLNAHFRVLRYDIYGHGYSDRPDLEAYNSDLYDRQLNELVEKLQIKEPFYLAGTSQGGSICAYYVANHPQKVEKLALLAPLFDDFSGKAMWSLLKTKGLGEYLVSVVGDKFFTNPANVLYSNNKNYELTQDLLSQMHFTGKKRAVLANIRGNALDNATDSYEKIKKQEIPVLLTWGDHDKSISRESIYRLRNLLPQAKYVELPNASHLAHYEFPEKINPILINFFQTEN
ncbi:MAG: alpha/beta hydrolase [Negativicutes bacterium]|nr:alpha/beta hydrolase [Negativicutes bacterium]